MPNPRLNPDKAVKKWHERARAGAKDWEENTQNPSRNPMEAAIAALEKWVNRIQEAIENGKWQAALAMVDMNEYKESVKRVGAQGFASAISNKAHKTDKALRDILPRIAAIQERIKSMPDATREDREARMIENKRALERMGLERRGIRTS